ncbi:NnrS family protein [Nitratiruptor tergarcus]|uniref:Uncharacterized protein involved in response to NO n=1 Tax=Nitratiruptor tergarcus DSM 16512 TaxID=1069081 RepID=A0A1W1WRG4_9BACT|nr:NnrS family protein [Nitratiruptor tergarcus]SMC08792.1 uncharacterized protein involved in response to NO [Nitratiruptor tergarcus DSM 16512]
MQFTQQKLSRRDYFFSQPHQPFFVLGVVNAIIFMGLFILAYRGVFDIDAKFFHSYSMIFLVFTNFFYGFLYTTFPRFSGTMPIDARIYLTVFLLQLIATLSFLVSIWLPFAFFAAALFVAAGFALTLRTFYGIYKSCQLPKKDQYWIIVALGVGVMSDILFLLSQISCRCNTRVFFDTAVNFGVYLYMIFLAFVVALRMVPFFSHVMDWKRSRFLHLEIFVLFLLHSFLHGLYPAGVFVVDLLAGLLIAWELKKIALPFPNKEPLLWILHIAFFWLAGGLILGSLIEAYERFSGVYSFALPLHLLLLGFLTTILIGFGTRVTLGHSGNMLRVDRVTVWIFYFTQIVVLGRVLFSLFAAQGKVFPFFDISAALFLVLFIWWLGKYFKILAFGEKLGTMK